MYFSYPNSSSCFTMEKILELFQALASDQSSRVKLALSKISDLDSFVLSYQMSPLSLAIKHGCSYSTILCLVLANKEHVNDGLHTISSLYYLNTNPLVIACKKGNLEIMKLLIDNGAIVEVKDCFGCPVLHIACEKGIEFVKLLILNGADPNSLDAYKKTPLHAAIVCGSSYQVVNFLLKTGVNTSLKDYAGKTAVALALEKEDLNPAIRIMLQTTMARRKKANSSCFSKSIKRKLMVSEPEKLREEANKVSKKLKKEEQDMNSLAKIKFENERTVLLKNSMEAWKKVSKDIDDGSSLFGINLDCPVCLEDFKSGDAIYQCSNGHLLCYCCITRLTMCPQCEVKMEKIRNRALENLIQGMNSF